MPRAIAEKAILRPSGDHVNVKISPSREWGFPGFLHRQGSARMMILGLPTLSVEKAKYFPSRLQPPEP